MSTKVHDGMTAKRRLTIEMARIRRHRRLLPPIAPPPGGGGPGTGTVLGSGTTNHLAKWIAVDTLGDSLVRDDGATVSIVRTTAPVDIFKILDTDGSFMLDVDKDGLIGINCDPDAMLTIHGGGLQAPISSGLVGWYRADAITGLADGANVVTWMDSSAGGNHLTATGCTSIDGASATRPHYNAAGTSKGMLNLPTVSFEGIITGSGDMGYFTIDTGALTLTAAAGWTIAFIIRDYSNVASDSYPFGANLPGGMDGGDNFIKNVNAANNTRWDTQSGVAKSFCGLYSHTPDGDVNEVVVLRCDTSGAGGALRTWVDGTLKAATGDTKTVNHILRYIGRILASVGNAAGVYGKAFAELMIFDRKLSDVEVDTVNTYLLSRVAGSVSGASIDLTRWKNTGGTLKGRVDSEGNLILPRASSAVTGVVFRDLTTPYPWIHDYTDPSDDDFPNLFIGKNAGNFTINGDGAPSYEGTGNIGIGELALRSLTKGYSNFAAGYHALGSCTTGFFNFALGEEALGANLTGSNNVAVGQFALLLNTSGGNSVCVGAGAGQTNVSGSQHVHIGWGADVASGALSNTIALGYGATVDASNKIVIGNASHTVATLYGATTIIAPTAGAFVLSVGAGVGTPGKGLISSSVGNDPAAYSFLLQPAVALTAGGDRWIAAVKDQPGVTRFSVASNGAISLYGEGATSGGMVNIMGSGGSTINFGIFFNPNWGATPGTPIAGIANSVCAANFGPKDDASCTATTLIGGVFYNQNVDTGRAHTNLIGAVFQAANSYSTTAAQAHGKLYGWLVQDPAAGKNQTATDIYGGYIEGVTAATPAATNIYSLYVEENTQTGGTIRTGIRLAQAGAASAYKPLTFRDQDAWISSRDAAHLDLNATTSVDVNIGTTEQLAVTSALLTVKDTFDIAVGTGTGTKIGTATAQKLGFWNVAPVIQPAGALQAAITNSSGGTGNGDIAALAAVAIDLVNSASQPDVNARMATINDNFTEVWGLLDAMRTALVASGMMKGAA